MKDIKKILSEHPDEVMVKGKQSPETLDRIVNELNFKPGPMLKRYLLDYGFISFGSVEFFGIGVKESGRLDIVKETMDLKNNFRLPAGFIVIEDIGDGLTIVCDESDKVFEFVYNNVPREINLNFNEYLIKRLTEA